MKRFLSNSIVFLIVFFLGYFTIDYKLNKEMVKRHISYTIPYSKYVVLGHSHPECSLNDTLIADLKNFASSAESYFYTLNKIKTILKDNKKTEVVFLEYTNNQITKQMDNWIWGSVYITNFYPLYSFNMTSEQKFLLFKKNTKGLVNANNLNLKKNIEKILFTNNPQKMRLNGGYNNLNFSKVDSILNSRKQNKDLEKFDNRVSVTNISYLEKIISFCKDKNVKLILFRSPIHSEYEVRQNEIKYKQILANNLKGVDYLDFSSFPLDNECYADLPHLNNKGAKIFSIWFNKLLNNGLLDSINKQQFIDEEISKLK